MLLCVSDLRATNSPFSSPTTATTTTAFLRRKPVSRPSRARPWISSRQQHVRCFTSSRSEWREALSQQQPSEEGQPLIDRTRSKLFKDADEAVADLKSGSTILSAGFGLCGTAGK